MHLESPTFDNQFKKWGPTQVVRERIATPFCLVQLEGPPPKNHNWN
jgi:hypothetical protein